MKQILEQIYEILDKVLVQIVPYEHRDRHNDIKKLKKLIDEFPDDNPGGEAVPHSGATAKIIKTKRIRGRSANK